MKIKQNAHKNYFFMKIIRSERVEIFSKPKSAIEKQARYLKSEWHSGKAFGIERIFRLLLLFSAFLFPTLYLREIAGKRSVIARKLCIEAIVISKIFLAILFLSAGFYSCHVTLFITSYFLLETVLYILAIILLSDIFTPPISVKRSVLLLVLNYSEVTLQFAVIYAFLQPLNNRICPLQAVYYSFVTSSTLGYGEFYPVMQAGQITVILHIVVLFLFVVLFFNYFATSMKLTRTKSKRKLS